jgi:hypothetical protein
VDGLRELGVVLGDGDAPGGGDEAAELLQSQPGTALGAGGGLGVSQRGQPPARGEVSAQQLGLGHEHGQGVRVQ